MATAQTNGSSSKPNGVVANMAGKRHRRSHEERVNDQLAHLSKSAERDKKRADRLALLSKQAAERSAAKLAKQEEIKNAPVGTKAAKHINPAIVIPSHLAEKITREVDAAIQDIAAKHKLVLRASGARIGARGNMISMVLRGTPSERIAEVATRHADMDREALYFIEQAKLVGLSTNLINSKVKLSGEKATFIVVGMKKVNNAVVLQEEGTDNFLRIPHAEFKSRYERVKK